MALPVSPVQPLSVLNGQANGRLSSSILVSFSGWGGGSAITCVRPAARAFKALFAAAHKAGHNLKTDTPAHSYRTYAQQVATFTTNYTTTYIPGRPYKVWQGRRWYQRPGVPVVALPGTSNHGWARAVDTGEERDGDVYAEMFDTATLNWLIANEQRFGISHEIQSEPWHLRYFAGDTPPAAVLAYEASLIPKPPEEDDEDMTIYIWIKDTRTSTAVKGLATLAEKPLVAGVHVYAVNGGVGVHQTGESMAIATYLSGIAKKPLTKIGSGTKPEPTVKDGKPGGWFSGQCLIDGPLEGIKK